MRKCLEEYHNLMVIIGGELAKKCGNLIKSSVTYLTTSAEIFSKRSTESSWVEAPQHSDSPSQTLSKRYQAIIVTNWPIVSDAKSSLRCSKSDTCAKRDMVVQVIATTWRLTWKITRPMKRRMVLTPRWARRREGKPPRLRSTKALSSKCANTCSSAARSRLLLWLPFVSLLWSYRTCMTPLWTFTSCSLVSSLLSNSSVWNPSSATSGSWTITGARPSSAPSSLQPPSPIRKTRFSSTWTLRTSSCSQSFSSSSQSWIAKQTTIALSKMRQQWMKKFYRKRSSKTPWGLTMKPWKRRRIRPRKPTTAPKRHSRVLRMLLISSKAWQPLMDLRVLLAMASTAMMTTVITMVDVAIETVRGPNSEYLNPKMPIKIAFKTVKNYYFLNKN